MAAYTHLPVQIRPRERLVQLGPSALSRPELLAIIMRVGSAQANLSVLANAVDRAISQGAARYHELLVIPHLGAVRAAAVCAALELCNRAQPTSLSMLDAAAVSLAMIDIAQQQQEYLVVFYLTSRYQIIERRVVTIGTLNASLIHPREVFAPAIELRAAACILAHNHPSGSTEPSSADLTVTKQLADAGNLLGIEVLDHVICAKADYLSLKMTNPTLFC